MPGCGGRDARRDRRRIRGADEEDQGEKRSDHSYLNILSRIILSRQKRTAQFGLGRMDSNSAKLWIFQEKGISRRKLGTDPSECTECW